MSLTLLDWRRRVAALYAAARTARRPGGGLANWRDGRDELFAGHPDSPLDEAARGNPGACPSRPYDPALRFEAVVVPAEPLRLEVPTATDGVVPFDRIGAVDLGAAGQLDVWWLGSYGGGVFVPLRDGSAGRSTYGGGPLPDRHRQGRRSRRGRRGGSWWTSTSPTTRPAPTTRAGRARWRPEGNRLPTVPVAAGEQLPPGGWY